MSTLVEIEEAIAKLQPTEFRSLLLRLKERETKDWDRQIEEDSQSGQLDALYARLTKGDGDQTKVPLDEVLDDPKFS